MAPPAGQGQRSVLDNHYARVGKGPVAYVDETYSAQEGHRNFYVMTAVVVSSGDRDPLRRELDHLVPGGWWHTSEELRTDAGWRRAEELLGTFRQGDEACVVVEKRSVTANDTDGEEARESVLSNLLERLCWPHPNEHEPVRLVVMEERRIARQNNRDRRTRARLLEAKRIDPALQLVLVSPGSDHLLWLPDLACSAYRQKLLGRGDGLFDVIEDLTSVTLLP